MLKWVAIYTKTVLFSIFLLQAQCSWLANLKYSDPTFNKSASNKSFIAEYYQFEYPFDPLTVRSVGSYTVLLHLLRTLVTLNKNVNYEGDLAKSWTISKDKKSFSFILAQEKYFSNGDRITAGDVVCSIRRQMKGNRATHFDFERIESVSGNGDRVDIKLKKPMPGFIHQLLHPEFGILHSSDCNRPLNELSYAVTSGPYRLKSGQKNSISLEKNKFYGLFTGPEGLVFQYTDPLDEAAALAQKNVDFVIGKDRTNFKEVKKLVDKGQVQINKPHYGFTYWLSINEFNPSLKSKKARLALAGVLSKHFEFPSDPMRSYTWGRSRQLYLPDGGGRLNDKEVSAIWSKIEDLAQQKPFEKVNLLFRHDFFLEDPVKEALRKAGLEFEIDHYHNFRDYEVLAESNREKYHLIQINNDFSSADLYENIQVSINPKRPLIFLAESYPKFENLLESLANSEKLDERYKFAQQIERELLEEGHIFPLALYSVTYLHLSNVSLENWSRFFPEISFWKIKWNEK